MKKSDSPLNYPYLDTKLPLKERVNDLISRMTIEEKIKLLPFNQEAIPRLNVNEYDVGGEAAHGVVARLGDVDCLDIVPATVFPQPIGLSSTWDENLLKEIGSAIGDEARVYNQITDGRTGLTLWAPTIDMERDPRWGRTEEAYGEDPHLTGKLSTELVKGMQGDDPFYIKLVAAPKHFYANNNEDGRVSDSSSVDPRNKHEYYLKAYKPAFVEGKAYSLMTAYNEINGTPCILNKEVQTIVKDEWGCDGFIVCDGTDLGMTVDCHKYYETHAESLATALKNGTDCFVDIKQFVIECTEEALKRGLITEKDIDKALTNILKIRFRLGHFDPKELNPYAQIPKSKLCCKEHNELALKASKESLVLLKNENNFLPLKKDKLQKVAVIGPLADVVYRDFYTGTHPYTVTPLEGIKNILKDKDVIHVEGYDEITITSKTTNKVISIDTENEDKVVTNGSPDDKENIFELTDWGFDCHTLKSRKNGKYLAVDDDDGYVTGCSTEVFGWYVRQVFNFTPCEDGSYVNLRTWCWNFVMDHMWVSDKAETEDSSKFKVNKISDGIEKAVKAAKESEVAIVFVGNNPLINGKEDADRKDLMLPKAQQELIKAVYEANPNTVVVIVGSYPFAINWENENIPAILYSSHSCQELGNAISSALFGDYSPAGRLSMTWYKSEDDLPPIKDYDIIKGKRTYMYFDKETLYPFGYGLSYSSFSYSNLKLSSDDANPSDNITITFDVQNTGNATSDEVVQLYTHCETSRVTRPIKELKGFKRINLNPGEIKNVTLTLKIEDLSYWDVTRDKLTVEKGNYTLMVGASSEDIRLKSEIFVNGEIIPQRNLNKKTQAENYDDYNNVFLHECKEDGTCTCNLKENSWISFKDVQLNDYTYFECRTTCESDGGYIDIVLDSIDGQSIGKLLVKNTGGPQNWSTCETSVASVSGIHDVYLKLSGDFKLSWFSFK